MAGNQFATEAKVKQAVIFLTTDTEDRFLMFCDASLGTSVKKIPN
jgi:hypothetical protein